MEGKHIGIINHLGAVAYISISHYEFFSKEMIPSGI
jgi:hypothetical protein